MSLAASEWGMSDLGALFKNDFAFGETQVRILEGDLENLPRELCESLDAVASSDDNYLTMGSGVSRLLAKRAGPDFVRDAQARCPLHSGDVVLTDLHDLHGLFPNAKKVLHAAVIDYDTRDVPVEHAVHQATLNCLTLMEVNGLSTVLLPAFATGAGGISMEACAQQMCGAIKSFLAHERPDISTINIFLYLPGAGGDIAKFKDRNRHFLTEANLVLGVPYEPVSNEHQSRDFYGRDAEITALEDIITGRSQHRRRHVMVLGGPKIGKWALLDQLFCRSQQPGSELGQNRHLVEVTFGRVHRYTPLSFVYRRFLCVLGKQAKYQDLREKIRLAFAEEDMNCDRFLDFLDEHEEDYPELVFLVDDLPALVQMEAQQPQAPSTIHYVDDFWRDLDRLGDRVRFVFTASNDEQCRVFMSRLDQHAAAFKQDIETIQVTCVTEEERQFWIDQLYQRYLDRQAHSLRT